MKWERKPLKKMDNRCIFMTSHNHMTLSSASKVNFAQKSFFSSFNYQWCLIMNREYFVKFQFLTSFFILYLNEQLKEDNNPFYQYLKICFPFILSCWVCPDPTWFNLTIKNPHQKVSVEEV